MCWRRFLCGGLMVLASALVGRLGLAEDSAARQQDERAIRETAKAYAVALAKGDAKAIAEFWTKDGDYFDELGNPHLAGELSADVDRAAGNDSRSENKVTSSKIRFLTADVAVEDGTSEVVLPDANGAPPERGQYHAIWVKQDSRWRLTSLCEMPVTAISEPRLSELDWMVGNWIADSDGTTLELNVQWNDGGTFLLRDTKAIRDGKVVLRGSQRIGWDPRTRTLKSWSFDSDGGHAEAYWVKEGDAWVGQSTGVLPDGRQSSSVTVMTFDGKDRYTRKVLSGRIDNEPIPDQELHFVRRAQPKP